MKYKRKSKENIKIKKCSPPIGFSAYCVHPLDLLFVEPTGFCSMLSSWPLGVLVSALPGGSLVQANGSHCPCLALSNLTDAWQFDIWWMGPLESRGWSASSTQLECLCSEQLFLCPWTYTLPPIPSQWFVVCLNQVTGVPVTCRKVVTSFSSQHGAR